VVNRAFPFWTPDTLWLRRTLSRRKIPTTGSEQLTRAAEQKPYPPPPKLAMNSLKSRGDTAKCVENEYKCNPNIRCATTAPAILPANCCYVRRNFLQGSPRSMASRSVTAGLRGALEIGPKVRMRATSATPRCDGLRQQRDGYLSVGKAITMMPEPPTAATRNAVPGKWDARRRRTGGVIEVQSCRFLS